jgi:predicted transglutaminase-like cysteine proteinase
MQRHREDDAFAPGNASMNQPRRKQWEALKATFPQMSPKERLRAINAFFNLVPVGLDIHNYGQEEYWAYPAEFLRKYSGDCEDIAIAKYFALRHLGWPKDSLWLVLVRDVQRKAGHAVIAARLGRQTFILDNLSRPRDRIVPHEAQAPIYRPILAMNETMVWVFPEAMPRKQ